MTAVTKTIVTCDRCKTQVTVGWPSKICVSWRTIYYWEWQEEKHLCEVCKKAFFDFMEKK
jgi:hypothetical protein